MNTNYKARADALAEAHAHIRRIGEALTTLVATAHKRGDKTTTNHALDAIEQLTELAKNHARQMRALLDEITNNPQHERPNQ